MFKNAIPYLLTPGFVIDPEMLARCPARPCSANEGRTIGFVNPCDQPNFGLVHRVADFHNTKTGGTTELWGCHVIKG